MKHLSHPVYKIVDAHLSGRRKIRDFMLDNALGFLQEQRRRYLMA